MLSFCLYELFDFYSRPNFWNINKKSENYAPKRSLMKRLKSNRAFLITPRRQKLVWPYFFISLNFKFSLIIIFYISSLTRLNSLSLTVSFSLTLLKMNLSLTLPFQEFPKIGCLYLPNVGRMKFLRLFSVVVKSSAFWEFLTSFWFSPIPLSLPCLSNLRILDRKFWTFVWNLFKILFKSIFWLGKSH